MVVVTYFDPVISFIFKNLYLNVENKTKPEFKD